MIDASSGESAGGDIHPDHAVGIAMGKRYINEAETLEVHVKAGDVLLQMERSFSKRIRRNC